MRFNMVVLLLAILIGVFGRLVIHLPNATPLACLSLLIAARYSRTVSIAVILSALFISDALLAHIYGYPILGGWSWFTYSGFLAMVLCGSFLKPSTRAGSYLLAIFATTLGYWLWTNLGVWMLGGLYPRTTTGLSTCFIAALPFLRNALIGNLIWMTFFLFLFKAADKWRVHSAQTLRLT